MNANPIRLKLIANLSIGRDRFGQPWNWLQLLVFAGIACRYLFFAPNYAWNAEETGTAYGADFLQEWVGARMVLTGHVSELYNVEVFRAWQYDPTIVGFEWKTDQYFPPVYPPPHYALFTPFALISYRSAVVVWLLLLLGAAWFSAQLIADIANHAQRIARSNATSTENGVSC